MASRGADCGSPSPSPGIHDSCARAAEQAQVPPQPRSRGQCVCNWSLMTYQNLHPYAQTNIQLYSQLLSSGYKRDELGRVHAAYTLASVLFAGRFQPSGKTFISHGVGTASILAANKLNADIVCAGLLHNVYDRGDFANRAHGLSSSKRKDIKRHVGPAVESCLAQFAALPWSADGFASLVNSNDLPAGLRQGLILRAADELEHLLDFDVHFFNDQCSRYYLDNAPLYIHLCRKLEVPELGDEIKRWSDLTRSSNPPPDCCRQADKKNSYIIVPDSYRRKTLFPTVRAIADGLQQFPTSVTKQLKFLYWDSINLVHRKAKAMRTRCLVSRRGCLESISKTFFALFESAALERVATGFEFTEGPVWIAEERCLLFSDIPANRIVKVSCDGAVATFRDPSGNSNGLTLDQNRRLIACEHGTRRVTRTERDGTMTVLADRYDGKKLNSPNDVVVRSDGTIFFTDPPYGIKPEEKELSFCGVYCLSPENGQISLIATDFECPNGLAFSPDETRLYVDDSRRRHIRVFDVDQRGELSNGSLFHDMNVREPGAPDGMKVDTEGNIYCTGALGVWVYNFDGKHLGTILTPEKPSNCAWGDDDSRSLYITAVSSVYRIRTRIPGIVVP